MCRKFHATASGRIRFVFFPKVGPHLHHKATRVRMSFLIACLSTQFVMAQPKHEQNKHRSVPRPQSLAQNLSRRRGHHGSRWRALGSHTFLSMMCSPRTVPNLNKCSIGYLTSSFVTHCGVQCRLLSSSRDRFHSPRCPLIL